MNIITLRYAWSHWNGNFKEDIIKVRILGKSSTLIQSYRGFYCRVEACSPVVLIKNCPTFFVREGESSWLVYGPWQQVGGQSVNKGWLMGRSYLPSTPYCMHVVYYIWDGKVNPSTFSRTALYAYVENDIVLKWTRSRSPCAVRFKIGKNGQT